MLDDIQRGLETLYRVETELDVRDFLLDAAARDSFAPTRSPREQLLIAESDGGLELGLFLDAAVLDNLAARDPRRGLDDGNLSDFLLMVEGVSHFVYLAWRARARRQVSALELELQAEIDKYVLLALEGDRFDATTSRVLHERLYERVHFCDPEGTEAGDRYRMANDLAARMVRRLEVLYAEKGRFAELRDALSRFYRMGQADKLQFVRAA